MQRKQGSSRTLDVREGSSTRWLEEVLNDEDVRIQVPNFDRRAAVKAPQRMQREEDGTKLGAKRWSWDHTSQSPLQWMGFFAH
eukprot:1339409-Rhodomonas_salina.1